MKRHSSTAKKQKQSENSREKSSATKLRIVKSNSKYQKFSEIDGSHPWQEAVPEAYIGYKVRVVEDAEVAYFNFELAKEMGLIPKNHPHKITANLKQRLIDTFSLCIINEYDIENNIEYPKHLIKPNEYMATRYLQLQHPNKLGKTSGDGRSIWNGVIKHRGKVWDVSSRGTGVTALAPGVVEAGKNLQTGSEEFGYGCGLAEIDELYATAIMSELFHKQGIPTERTLLVLDTGPGVGIGVRAGENLLRPAHLFSFMKQGNWDALKRSMDYFIDRQTQNKKMKPANSKMASYRKLVKEISETYARFAAKLESDYIFAWFDWDGDNMLMDIGILDYGSIRQFGIRHDEYRYDDVTRFSTNLNEQKDKSRRIVQTFCQILDFLETKNKKAITEFDDHRLIKHFDKCFDDEQLKLFEEKLGLSKVSRLDKTKKYQKQLKDLFVHYTNLECFKSTAKLEAVDDGVNKPPFFNARTLLRECSSLIPAQEFASSEELFERVQSEFSYKASEGLTMQAFELLDAFCISYNKLFDSLKISESQAKQIKSNAFKYNHPERITGNSITYIVNEILALRSKDLAGDALQKFIDLFIYNQVKKINPDIKAPTYTKIPKQELKNAFQIVKTHFEDI